MSAEVMLTLATALNNAITNKLPFRLPAMKFYELEELNRCSAKMRQTAN
jgi:hypothetical protein